MTKIKVKVSNHPQKIDDCNWYYENRGSITFVHEARRNGLHVCTDIIRIPWKKLIESAKRCRPEEF